MINEHNLWSKVDRRGDDECWPWLAYRDPNGYGLFHVGGRDVGAHRAVYRVLVGPIPEGNDLDHLCRNPSCVNPAHLEPVTHRENVLRGTGWAARHAAKTHCDHGHPFDERNTRWLNKPGRGPSRRCLTCHRDGERRRKRAKASA